MKRTSIPTDLNKEDPMSCTDIIDVHPIHPIFFPVPERSSPLGGYPR